MPVAVNSTVMSMEMTESAGSTWMDTSVASVTPRAVFPDTAPSVALMVAEPTPRAEANPSEPAALLTEATETSDELQVTCFVRSWVDGPSRYPLQSLQGRPFREARIRRRDLDGDERRCGHVKACCRLHRPV